MSDHFSVFTRDLVAHSNSVDRIGDRVKEAGDAGRTVRTGGEAYGKLCGFLPPLLAGLQDALIQGITNSATELRDTAQKLRTSAERYDATDAKSAESITRGGRLQ